MRRLPMNLLATTLCCPLFVLAACTVKNPHYCADRPNNLCDDGGDAPIACMSNDQCAAPKAICDVAGSKICVQCIAPGQTSACMGATPTCSSDNTCQACSAHADCGSAACLPDGSCAMENEVAYLDSGGTDNPTCSKALPCTKFDKALVTGRMFVKIKGMINEQVTINNRSVTLLADPGAKLTSTNSGVILRVDGSSVVNIYDLEISNGLGAGGIGLSMPAGNSATVNLRRAKLLNNTGGGINTSNGNLTVSQSTISSNAGGGISLTNGTFVIVGNVFFNNGTQLGSVGGVAITASQNAANRLEFNSFNKNQTQDGLGTAIQCIAGSFTARNNILSGNGTASNLEQTGGTCLHAYSIVRPGALPAGTGNSAMDPLFTNTTTGDLHLMAGSPALGAADPSSNLLGAAEFDIDEQKRTSPADLGADEVP